MTTYILDIFLQEAELFTPCSSIRTPIWININADGLQQTFSTGQVAPCPHPVWNSSARFVLKLHSLHGAHFKASLMTHGQGGQVRPVAMSQVRLETVPVGTPRRFTVPLMLVPQFTVQAASLVVTAAISSLPQQHGFPMSQPAGVAERRTLPVPQTAPGHQPRVYPMPQLAPPPPQFHVPPPQFPPGRRYPEPQFYPNAPGPKR